MLTLAMGLFPAGLHAQDCAEGAYGCGHAEHHEQYKDWHRPDGMSCCNQGDCRPTRAYQDMDGTWHAWDGRTWRPVPPEALMQPDLLQDGRNHVCAPESGATVYCFSPTGQKS